MKTNFDKYLEAVGRYGEPEELTKQRLRRNKRLKRTYGTYPTSDFKLLEP